MNLIWVIGQGGMLGSNLAHELPHHGLEVFTCPYNLNWSDKYELFSQLERSVEIFSEQSKQFNHWTIFWAAGVSSMTSSDLEISRETEILKYLIDCIKHSKLISLNGMLSIASSAGAVYANSEFEVISEDSHVSPNSFYGIGKLEQEKLLANISNAVSNISTSVFRISTLYGYRLNGYSRQGLIGMLALKILNHEEVELFVPLNTYRDFIHVKDASFIIASALKNMIGKSGNFIKIVASENSYSIEQVIDIFKKKTNLPVRVVVTHNKYSDLYHRRIIFRSNSLKISGDRINMSLEAGIVDLLNKFKSLK